MLVRINKDTTLNNLINDRVEAIRIFSKYCDQDLTIINQRELFLELNEKLNCINLTETSSDDVGKSFTNIIKILKYLSISNYFSVRKVFKMSNYVRTVKIRIDSSQLYKEHKNLYEPTAEIEAE